jgi:hypothetical protein
MPAPAIEIGWQIGRIIITENSMEQLIGMWACLILSKLNSDETFYAVFYMVFAFLFLLMYIFVK